MPYRCLPPKVKQFRGIGRRAVLPALLHTRRLTAKGVRKNIMIELRRDATRAHFLLLSIDRLLVPRPAFKEGLEAGGEIDPLVGC